MQSGICVLCRSVYLLADVVCASGIVNLKKRGSRLPGPDPDEELPDSADAGPVKAGSGQPQLDRLQADVVKAVRTAISGAMAQHTPAGGLAELDLDFSVHMPSDQARLPVLRAEAERALTAQVSPTPARASAWRLVLALSILSAAGAVAVIAALLSSSGNSVHKEAAQALLPAATPAEVKQVASTPAPAAATTPANAVPDRDILDTAHDLIQSGKIVKARAILQDTAHQRPAAALLLAQSYDPNFLAALAASDAQPDVAQARQWYTRWYDLASKQGEVSQAMRLDLLLRSLDTAKAKP